jgi:hypothetical protein
MRRIQQRMTRAQFERWLVDNAVRTVGTPSVHLVACACRDVNCHGWRFVEVPQAQAVTAHRSGLRLAPLEHEY